MNICDQLLENIHELFLEQQQTFMIFFQLAIRYNNKFSIEFRRNQFRDDSALSHVRLVN